MKKNGFAHRLGYRLGRFFGAYTRREVSIIRWLKAKGFSSAVVRLLVWTVKIVLIGTLLYFVFWLAAALIVCLVLGLAGKGGTVAPDPVVGFDGDKLFPDPSAPENLHDPKLD